MSDVEQDTRPEDAPARLWDLLDGFRTETEKMYSGEKGSADWEVARDAILVYVARRLRERTDTGEGAPELWIGERQSYSGLWITETTVGPFWMEEAAHAWRDRMIQKDGWPEQHIRIVPLFRRHQPTDEGREG